MTHRFLSQHYSMQRLQFPMTKPHRHWQHTELSPKRLETKEATDAIHKSCGNTVHMPRDTSDERPQGRHLENPRPTLSIPVHQQKLSTHAKTASQMKADTPRTPAPAARPHTSERGRKGAHARPYTSSSTHGGLIALTCVRVSYCIHLYLCISGGVDLIVPVCHAYKLRI